MKRTGIGFLIVTLSMLLAARTLAAQKAKRRPPAGAQVTAGTSLKGGDAKSSEPELVADPRLQKIQKNFVIEAATLAKDYEKKRDIEGARNCYEQILRLVPHHPAAEEALKRIRDEERTAEKKKLQVRANEGWQDTGVIVLANRPLSIHAEGVWTFKMEHQLSADGMKIPEDLRDFNLGCLVGRIVTSGDAEESKPFEIGKDAEFTPEATGRLQLRMYDSDPSDNKGQLNVEIQGTFEKGK